VAKFAAELAGAANKHWFNYQYKLLCNQLFLIGSINATLIKDVHEFAVSIFS
jgi:hypothetical protein